MTPENHYDTFGEFTPEEILPQVIMPVQGQKMVKVRVPLETSSGTYQVKMTSQRLQLFTRSMTCFSCNAVGEVFRLQCAHWAQGPMRKFPHLNLWGRNSEGQWVLFTKDHIVPKSKGGPNHLNNYQTMCQPCNVLKGNRMAGPEKSLPNLSKSQV